MVGALENIKSLQQKVSGTVAQVLLCSPVEPEKQLLVPLQWLMPRQQL
jgi:hypothetical protein